MNQKVLIVGLGLIGSSLALAIQKEHPKIQLVGWDIHEESCQMAVERKIIDYYPDSFEQGAKEADIIILAIPVKSALVYLKKLGQLKLKENVLVTDVGSTKVEIMKQAQKEPFTFVGGHPMAGSHKSGVTAADIDLFENAYYIFTSLPNQGEEVSYLKQLFSGTRAKYIDLTAKEHDQITGMLSHLPHIIASGLVNQADKFNQEHPGATQLAAGGFRDITRIASADPTMWADILLSNDQVLLEQIDTWQSEITQVATWIKEKNYQEIYNFFDRAKDTRDRLPVRKKGAIPAFYDLFVDVPDTPGVIAEVTGLLGQADVSIINLKIQETREDIMGVLQISFKNQKDLSSAKRVLEKKTNYHCHMKIK
ncbi:MAG: prephenate dehydrogenase [Enterococcus sp.]